jgi:ATPase family associated with various cellular activities (AAA)
MPRASPADLSYTACVTEFASPYSTGGGGPDFETRVLAHYLGYALTKAIPRGLPDATARRVSSQALYQGAPLDDILVQADRGDGDAQLVLQVKRDLTFGEENDEFVDVMRRAWETFTSEQFHEGVDRFGVVLGLYSKKIAEHYETVLTWARHATTHADFLKRINTPRVGNQTQRTFLSLVRTLIARAAGREDVADDELWRFCRSFVLIHFDLQAEASRDAEQLQTLLRLALNIDEATRAHDLELALFEFASEMKLNAGTQSTGTLRTALAPQFGLRPARGVVADLRRLKEHARFILDDIETTAGGVGLPREEQVRAAATSIAENRIVGLGGDPGTGKSGILRLLLERANAQSSTLLLSGDRLIGTDWPTFAQHLGLSTPLRDLLHAIGTSTEPCVFIDGIDRAATPSAQRIINDLLRVVSEVSVANARPWTVVFTSRSQNLPHVVAWMAVPPGPSTPALDISSLTDDEFAEVAATHPSLVLLDGDERLRPITRNLFMVSRLTDPRIAAQLPTQNAESELDIASIWWTHVVGAGGTAGVARQGLLIQLAEDLLRDVRIHGAFNPEALHSLESDRIVSRDSFGVVRFTHDLFEDWAFARLLGQKEAQLPVFLANVSAPFRLQRAVRLFAAMLLQEGAMARWRQLLLALESDAALKERWQQTVLAAPLLSARATELLTEIKAELLEGAGERLRALLTAAVTIDVGPNAFWGTMLRALPARPELAALFMHEPTPRWSIWIPLVTWLTQEAGTVPGPIRLDAVRVLELWQAHASEGSILRTEVADVALGWLTDRVPIGNLSDDAERRYFSTLRKIVFASADVRPAEVAEIVRRIAENRHSEAGRQLVSSGAGLAKHIPAAYVDALVTLIIRERERSRHHLLDDFDFDDRPFYPAAHMQGPFLYLLKFAEGEGLRLIHTLANTATDRWREGEDPRPTAIVLNLRSGPQEFLGTLRVYLWFRPDSMAPPSVVSGLMALEFWMEQQIEAGRDPVELFETVLAGSHCIAMPGLCLGIALAYPEKCLRAALPIVTVSHFWLLDVSRRSHDLSGSFSGMLLGDQAMGRIAADRDKQPQRTTDIRYLSPMYLFGEDDDLRAQFETAVAGFAEHLPIFYEEQLVDAAHLEELRADIRREMAFGNPANYAQTEHEGRTVVYFVKPEEFVERDAPEQERFAEMNRRLSLLQWAEKTIKDRTVAPAWTVDDAVQAAIELGDVDALRAAMNEGDDSLELHRGRAVAATAAAIAITAQEWLREHDRMTWCIDVLEAASTASGSALDGYGARAVIPNDPHTYAVQGFAALSAGGVHEDRIRIALLRLSIDQRLRVVAAVAGELRSLWAVDRPLAWEILALGVHSNLSTPYREYSQERDPAHDEELLAPHITALRDGVPSTLSRVGAENDSFFVYGFLYLAQGLPIDLMWADDEAREPFITLTEDVVTWTITLERAARARDSQYGKHVPDEWDDVLAMWLARLAAVTDEPMYDRLVIAPLKDAATEPLPLVAEYLKAYMWAHFDRQDAVPALLRERWAAFARWLLQTDHVHLYRKREHVSREIEDVVSLIIFMRYGSPMFKPAWNRASEFASIISDWTLVIAPSQRGFSKLLLLLENFAGAFSPVDVVAWLTRFVSGPNGLDPARLSGDYGERTAQALNGVWAQHQQTIIATLDLRTEYGSLVDTLLGAGVALAGVLVERMRGS